MWDAVESEPPTFQSLHKLLDILSCSRLMLRTISEGTVLIGCQLPYVRELMATRVAVQYIGFNMKCLRLLEKHYKRSNP